MVTPQRGAIENHVTLLGVYSTTWKVFFKKIKVLSDQALCLTMSL